MIKVITNREAFGLSMYLGITIGVYSRDGYPVGIVSPPKFYSEIVDLKVTDGNPMGPATAEALTADGKAFLELCG